MTDPHREPPPPAIVDWAFATSTARRLTPSGPRITADEAQLAVDELRVAARRSRSPVAETARLHTPAGAPSALVVDRPTWIDVNADSFASLVDPVVAATVRAAGRTGRMPAVVATLGGKVTGAEVAGLLSYMSTKVLGQYELAPAGTAADARLLLVAPNIVQAERDLRAVPSDFRQWVCLHEETHRVQFTAVDWLRGHLVAATRQIATDLAPELDTVLARLRGAASHLPQALGRGGGGVAELFVTDEQRRRVAEVTAVMALLEGHADVVMDAVGPQVVPTVDAIRAAFERRRRGAGPFDVLVRRLVGLEAKMAQYRDGAAFVRAVTDRVGVDGFNAVWTSSQTLPTPEEIQTPQAWVARVHG